MREIKFRAWDIEAGAMRECAWVGQWEAMVLFPNDKTLFDGRKIMNHVAIGEFPKTIEVIQFTGLRDKNGNEIYEGDIVTGKQDFGVDEFSDVRDLIEIVEYHEGAFYPICNMPPINYEVVGNVRENPELLK